VDPYRRWKVESEVEGLTWGVHLEGQPILETLRDLDFTIESEHVMLEIGPGYGRTSDLIQRQGTFKRCYLVEINAERAEMFRVRYSRDPRVVVLHQNADELILPESFDRGLSTLTVKHFYPDFTKSFFRLRRQISSQGLFVFDLHPLTDDFYTFGKAVVRYYAPETFLTLLELLGFTVIRQGTVRHDSNHVRQMFLIRPTGVAPAAISPELAKFSRERHMKALQETQRRFESSGRTATEYMRVESILAELGEGDREA
jgi:SAM-dependent methyltransferase